MFDRCGFFNIYLDLMSLWAMAGFPLLPNISVCRWDKPQAILWVNLKIFQWNIVCLEIFQYLPSHPLGIQHSSLEIVIQRTILIVISHQQHLSPSSCALDVCCYEPKNVFMSHQNGLKLQEIFRILCDNILNSWMVSIDRNMTMKF